MSDALFNTMNQLVKPPIKFDNTYIKLPKEFYHLVAPEEVSAPKLIKFNHKLAKEIGLTAESFDEDVLAKIFSGNQLLESSQPLAQAYAGHQFGSLSPQLGDGRALLLGEVVKKDGQRVDVQLKGSGRTIFSRGGDGKATLYSVLREYLIAEAMHALGIPSTRSLAVVASGETIVRNGVPVPSAILTRIAASHIRVGTFQYFAVHGENELVKELADYTIERHFPEAKQTENPYIALLEAVIDRQIHLITQWIRVGFIHGVMNTDNMTVSGETIDYGPCAFLDKYNPEAKFSSIDRRGRYAFANQGTIGYWNLARFAESLVSLVDIDTEKSIDLLTKVLETYPDKFEQSLFMMQGHKLGLREAQLDDQAEDQKLINDFLNLLHQDEVDYTLAFRALTNSVANNFASDELQPMLKSKDIYIQWRARWRQRLGKDAINLTNSLSLMQKANPIYIPRNWHVEQALTQAADKQDFSYFDELFTVLQQPYVEQKGYEKYINTPVPSTSEYKTYCGT